MEDLILVTGCTLVTSWGVAAFLDDTQDSGILLRSQVFDDSEASFEWRMARGSVAFQNSQMGRVRSVTLTTAKFAHLIFSRIERSAHVRINVCLSEVFEQSASR